MSQSCISGSVTHFNGWDSLSKTGTFSEKRACQKFIVVEAIQGLKGSVE